MTLAIAIYLGGNAYVFARLFQFAPRNTAPRVAAILLYWSIALSYVVARLLESRLSPPLAEGVLRVGSLWLAALTYLILALILVDLLKGVDRLAHFMPPRHLRTVTVAAVAVALLAVLGGWINASHPQVRRLDLTVAKASPLPKLTIVLATDLHMGTIVANGLLDRIVDLIDAQNPDIVLFSGDLVDEDIAPVMRRNLGNALLRLRAKYGVYGVTGNHEYIGGAEAAVAYLQAHGVTMLRDRAETIAGAFVLVGREDLSRRRFTGTDRASLKTLLQGVDPSLPTIVMDHQPVHLEEAAEAGVDLQLSGHTHNGQLWPFNYIVESIFEDPFGYLRKGNTQFYVSCGVGTWGPPVRTSSRPEIVRIDLSFRP